MFTHMIRVQSHSAFNHSPVSLSVSGRRLIQGLLLLVGLLLESGLGSSAQAGELHPGQNFSEWDQIPMATGATSSAKTAPTACTTVATSQKPSQSVTEGRRFRTHSSMIRPVVGKRCSSRMGALVGTFVDAFLDDELGAGLSQYWSEMMCLLLD